MTSSDPKRWIRLLSTGLSSCRNEAAQYGKCVIKNLDNLNKGVCQKEWEAFYQCYLKAVKDGKKYKRF
jgi:hypothetical protein